MESPIIGLYSPAPGSGKSTIAQILLEEKKYQCLSFAGPLKQMSLAFFKGMGYSDEQACHLVYNKDFVLPGINVTVRKIMQTIGTDWGRKIIHENVWIDMWTMRAKNYPLVCVDDVRFENEAQAVKSMGGQVWKVVRPDAENRETHQSEGRLDNWDGFDRVVINDGTIEQLRERILEED